MFKINLLAFILLLLLTLKTSGDIISFEPKEVQVPIYSRIANLEEFPDVALIGCKEYKSLFRKDKVYLISAYSCLELNEHCSFKIYAVKKDYIKDKDISDIDLEDDINVLKSDITIPNSETVKTLENISNIDDYYKIAGFTNNSLVLYKSMRIIKYSNGKPDKSEHYKYEGDLSKLSKTIR